MTRRQHRRHYTVPVLTPNRLKVGALKYSSSPLEESTDLGQYRTHSNTLKNKRVIYWSTATQRILWAIDQEHDLQVKVTYRVEVLSPAPFTLVFRYRCFTSKTVTVKM